MFAKDIATFASSRPERGTDRRGKFRFRMQRELRYKLVKEGLVTESGAGETVDIGSGGVGFVIGRALPANSVIELSISWPVLLDNTCAMRLVVFGRVLRTGTGKSACTIDKYEFRTQGRLAPTVARIDSNLQRWAGTLRKEPPSALKSASVAV